MKINLVKRAHSYSQEMLKEACMLFCEILNTTCCALKEDQIWQLCVTAHV